MRVELSGQRISFPSQCTCCGESPNADHYVASSINTKTSTTCEWPFPLCDHCQAHRIIYQRGARIAGVSFGLSVLCAVLMSWWAVVGGILLAGAIAYWTSTKAEPVQRPTCATTGPPATFVAWRGAVQVFDIPSDAYATAFLRENASNAVNLTVQARTALEGTQRWAPTTQQAAR